MTSAPPRSTVQIQELGEAVSRELGFLTRGESLEYRKPGGETIGSVALKPRRGW